MKISQARIKAVKSAATTYYNAPEVIECLNTPVTSENYRAVCLKKYTNVELKVVAKLAIQLGFFEMTWSKQEELKDVFEEFYNFGNGLTSEQRNEYRVLRMAFTKYWQPIQGEGGDKEFAYFLATGKLLK